MTRFPDNEVHLWYASPAQLTADPAVAKSLTGWLSADEIARMERYRFEKDRLLFLTAHGLVRWVLSRYALFPPAVWQFACGPWGKPEIADPPEGRRLQFNLSHTRGLAAVAVSTRGKIGVDVETVDRTGRVFSARHFLAPAEVAQLEARPDSERADFFAQVWTLREAYLKARGTGLSAESAAFGFDLSHGHPRPWFSPQLADAPERWQFWQDLPGPDHRAAVAILDPVANTRPLSLCVFTADFCISK